MTVSLTPTPFPLPQQLILISGYPSSGKTHRSKQLVDFFTSKIQQQQSCSSSAERRLSVIHINDQSLGVHRDVYREAQAEKDARAAEYSAVKRGLGKETIVVADGMNYIKGFRYQLYCEAKAVGTGCCVVSGGFFFFLGGFFFGGVFLGEREWFGENAQVSLGIVSFQSPIIRPLLSFFPPLYLSNSNPSPADPHRHPHRHVPLNQHSAPQRPIHRRRLPPGHIRVPRRPIRRAQRQHAVGQPAVHRPAR